MAKILIVDDEGGFRYSLRIILRGLKHEAILVSSADEVIAQIPVIKPDLIITDIEIGNVGGFEVLRAAKQYDPRVPVIIISFHYEEEYIAKAKEMGADDYFTKPVDVEKLLVAISRLLNPKG